MKYKALTEQEEQRFRETPSAPIVRNLEIAEVEMRKQDQLAVKPLIDQH
jgi:hypothetical protein